MVWNRKITYWFHFYNNSIKRKKYNLDSLDHTLNVNVTYSNVL